MHDNNNTVIYSDLKIKHCCKAECEMQYLKMDIFLTVIQL